MALPPTRFQEISRVPVRTLIATCVSKSDDLWSVAQGWLRVASQTNCRPDLGYDEAEQAVNVELACLQSLSRLLLKRRLNHCGIRQKRAKKAMITRRAGLVAAVVALTSGTSLPARALHVSRAVARETSYSLFLRTIAEQARSLGISRSILDDALSLDQPNIKVLALDRYQPEFQLSWNSYRRRVLTAQKVQAARAAYQGRLSLLTKIWRRYRVDPRIIVGIWGLESNYGSRSGSFGVVDALATLTFDGRRRSFFHRQLMDALRILQQGDIGPANMVGSYAGAMGQPQFMPTSYLRYAVDEDGDGRRDIWSSEADVFASISNYLAKNGWVAGAPWGQPVAMPSGFDAVRAKRYPVQSLGYWMRMGVRRLDGDSFSRRDVSARLLLPDGMGGEAFLVYDNFEVLRRYNPSDFYGLAVGLLGSATA